MKPGDVVWGPAGGHPAVVLDAVGGRVLVISGTGTGPRDIPHVRVDHGNRLGRRMGLTKPTYSYETALHVCDEADLTFRGQTCPGDIYAPLSDMAQAAAPRILPAESLRVFWQPG